MLYGRIAMANNKKALVTGGSGFLGSYLLEALISSGIQTSSYDNRPPDFPRSDIGYITGNILDLPALQDAVQDCDLVFHTAAIANINDTRKIPIETMGINVVGTTTCLEAARLAETERFIFASSVYVAGKLGSFYRISKQAGEYLCKTFYEEHGLPFTIIRYGSLYGGRANYWNMIYNICRDLLLKGEYQYYGTGAEMREFIHIEDAARETVRVAADEQFRCKAVLITGHQRMQIREFFELIREIMGNRVTFGYLCQENHGHYDKTPYYFEPEMPVRVNMNNYVDIAEGILQCLKQVDNDLKKEQSLQRQLG